MSDNVKRYGIHAGSDGRTYKQQSATGYHVSYDDYEKLEKEKKALEESYRILNNEYEWIKKECDKMEDGLHKLGGSNCFARPRMMNKDRDAELIARMEYARQILI